MGSILASALIAQSSELLQDESNVTWRSDQLLAWLNEGQRAIAGVKPDASMQTKSLQLVAGTRQTIDGLRLFSVTRNMGTDGLTPGRGIRLVERALKDDFDPTWHTEQASATVNEYIYDARSPRQFYVSPPVVSGPNVYVEITQSVNPTDLASSGDAISLDDIYAPALIEWMVYRALARETEEIPDLARAAAHFRAFFNLLNVKMQVDMADNPKLRNHLK